MKHPVLTLLGLLAVAAAPAVQAVEILRWERMPLALPLKVGQERVVFIDRNVRVGVPAGVGERLRVQSAGGAVYLRASEPIEPTRLQLQDADTGALILLDIAAEPAKDGEAELEPVRIVEGNSTPARYGLTNSSSGWITLDPRVLQGDFLTATFQHEALGPRGTPEDTTVLYLVTRGRGLAQSLLPAVNRFDPAVHLPQPEASSQDGTDRKEVRHAQ